MDAIECKNALLKFQLALQAFEVEQCCKNSLEDDGEGSTDATEH